MRAMEFLSDHSFTDGHEASLQLAAAGSRAQAIPYSMADASGPNGELKAGPFVSYAREDWAFVRTLHAALEKRQRDTWVDWEGIYPSEEWMAKIRSAIDSAQAFVFVISPDSVASRVCGEEIEHAVKQNKRVIPLLAKDVDAASVHSSVSRLNWLRFLAADDFEKQVDALVEAMDMDLDWLHSHTRLLVRSEEWHARDQDGSLLLRGGDLRQAETWLLSADAALKRVPTQLQSQFIVASRRAETRRRNVQRVIAAVAIVVLTALSIYSWFQKTAAETQRNMAVSRQVAMRAAQIPEDDKIPRLLIGALAARYSHTAEADASLSRALALIEPISTVLWSRVRNQSMDCLAFHREGKYLAGSNTHGVTVWEVATGREQAFLSREHGASCVSFGPRDDVVTIADQGRAVVWEWRTNQQRTFGAEPDQKTSRSAFSADGGSVFVASDGRVTRWDLKQGTSHVVVEEPASDFKYAFSEDGRRVASAGEESLSVWDLETAKPVATLTRPTGPLHLALSADGRTLAAGFHNVLVWDLENQNPSPVAELQQGVSALAFSRDGKTLIGTGREKQILQWNFGQRRLRSPLASPKHGAASFAFSPDGSVLAVGSFGAVVMLRPSRQFEHILKLDVDVELQAEESDRNGTRFALKRGLGFILWDPSGTRQPIVLPDAPDDQSVIRLSPHGNVLAILEKGGRIHLWNTETGQRAPVIEGKLWRLAERVELDQTGALLAAVGIDGALTVSDWRTGATWSKGAADTGHTRSAAFSADGQRAATGGLEGAIHLWNAKSGEHLFSVQNVIDKNVLQLAFSLDGRLLAASTAGVIAIWDLDTRSVRRTLRGHTGLVTSLAFSPTGTFLASGSTDKTARVWNPESGEPVITLEGASLFNLPTHVAFSADGKTLSVKAGPGNVTLWDVDPAHWAQLACRIANRNLTREEWETYVTGDEYLPACPEAPIPADIPSAQVTRSK